MCARYVRTVHSFPKYKYLLLVLHKFYCIVWDSYDIYAYLDCIVANKCVFMRIFIVRLVGCCFFFFIHCTMTICNIIMIKYYLCFFRLFFFEKEKSSFLPFFKCRAHVYHMQVFFSSHSYCLFVIFPF